MSKPICVRSTVFKICQEALMTELLRALPLTNWCDLDRVLYNAHEAAKKHVEQHPKLAGRHSRYKVHLFFKHMAERLPDISPLFQNVLGMKGAPELESPDVGVEEDEGAKEPERPWKAILRNLDPSLRRLELSIRAYEGLARAEVVTLDDLLQRSTHDLLKTKNFGRKIIKEIRDALKREGLSLAKEAVGPTSGVVETVEPVQPDSERMRVALRGKTPPTEPPPPPSSESSFEDEFAGMYNVPKFEDFETVFGEWPYVVESMLDGDRVLVLGYLSGRDPRNNDALVRRNCAYTFRDVVDKPFKGLVSMVGYLKKTVRGNRLHIKVIPYHVGAKVRCWTNVQGEGDRIEYNRYFILGEEGLVRIKTRGEYDAA